ncbi:MAG: 4'-phosphopantetheinyl transferase superfamily protein [Anaerolineae bacterium]
MTDVAWHSSPDRLTLLPGEVHVWRIVLETTRELEPELRDALSADERARANRLVFDGHRARFVATRGWLRSLLGRYLGIDARDVSFTYGSNGKPMLAPAMAWRLEFSVSHAEDLALVALSLEQPVGVDAEPVRTIPELAELAELVFAPTERAAWEALPAAERNIAFFETWTRKEAVLKGLGDGLSRAPRELEVGWRHDADVWRDPVAPHTQWRLTSFCPLAGNAACVAVQTVGLTAAPNTTFFDITLASRRDAPVVRATKPASVTAAQGVRAPGGP